MKIIVIILIAFFALIMANRVFDMLRGDRYYHVKCYLENKLVFSGEVKVNYLGKFYNDKVIYLPPDEKCIYQGR